MYSNTVADKSDFCVTVNVKLKQIKPVKAISHRVLWFSSTGTGSD